MDLSKMSNEKKLQLCRYYFKGKTWILLCYVSRKSRNLIFLIENGFILAGFALLPFVWAVNAIWFFKEAFCKDRYDEQPQIKRCLYYFRYWFIVEYGNSFLVFRRYIFWYWGDFMEYRYSNLGYCIPSISSQLGRDWW